MTEKLSYIEKMESIYVLNETKSLLKQRLEATKDPQEQSLIEEDLHKIEQEIISITGKSPNSDNYNAVNFVFPYYEADDE